MSTKVIERIVKHVTTSDDPKTWGKYKFTGDKLVYRNIVTRKLRAPHYYGVSDTQKQENIQWAERLAARAVRGEVELINVSAPRLVELIQSGYRTNVQARYLAENEIARKINTPKGRVLVGNSAMLDLIGRRVSWGREANNREETDIQRELALKAPMLPFPVFEAAKMDLNTLEIIEQGGAETVTRNFRGKYNSKKGEYEVIKRQVHFTGASLFSVADSIDGSVRTWYLFDIDRAEIKHGIFNPFLVKLPCEVSTIKDAYLALKPDAVLKAEKRGLRVRRQGEWFFIPAPKALQKTKPDMERSWNDNAKKRPRRLELRAGPNRPNYAQYGNEKKKLVKGKISHSGREHRDIVLDTWCYAVPNTATESFTITGDID